MQNAPRLTEGEFTFRDLNKNGKLDPYEDTRRPIDERVEDLLSQMTLEEKAGLMFHMIAGVNQDGSLNPPSDGFGRGMPIAELVGALLLNHFNVHALPAPRLAAQWYNNVQALAESTRLGIPVTISSDPRHAFSNNPATSFFAGDFSQWPEPIGLAATGDSAWSRNLATSPGRNIWRSAFAWRCTPWPTLRPSRAGRGSTAPSARMPQLSRG